MAQELVQALVCYRGRVQGVGFRWTAREVAARFAVSGYVRNCDDGSVVLVAEGDRGEIERFLAAVRGRMGRYIGGEDVSWAAASGAYASFLIRH